jgi:transcriptional regulator with XRE-family HTH domain
MNRRDFGELVAALRQDLGWTQFQLAEYSGLDDAVISQMERGVKRHFDPDLLFCLANAFQLTTLERREFIFAASGLDENQIVRQLSGAMATDVFDAKKILERMIALTGQLRIPAFLCDVYSDIVAANFMMIAFYDVPVSMMENAASVPAGYNTTRLNFGRDLVGRTLVTDNWDTYALNSMRAFRENSLRYRARPYFKYLMNLFRNPAEYPFFDRYWKLVSSMEQDRDVTIDRMEYCHNKFGTLNYVAATTAVITSFGNLLLVQNHPLDEGTEDVFLQLRLKAGFGVARFASWPEKPLPEKE